MKVDGYMMISLKVMIRSLIVNRKSFKIYEELGIIWKGSDHKVRPNDVILRAEDTDRKEMLIQNIINIHEILEKDMTYRKDLQYYS